MLLKRLNLVLIAFFCMQTMNLLCVSGSVTTPGETITRKIAQYEQLALKGDARAQYEMGRYYLKGTEGFVSPQQMALAEKWFRLSARQGHAGAMFGLASVLSKRAKTVEEENEVAALFEDAARKGHKDAQFRLAIYILKGKANLERDEKRAVELLRQSAQQDNPRADMVLVDLAHHQECDLKIGRQCLERLKNMAGRGDVLAQYYLGKIYENGYITPQNYPTAIAWYKKAAAQNYSFAYIKLGVFYESGAGSSIDYKTAMRCYRTALDLGNFTANQHIARLYEMGFGVPKNDEKAVKYYARGAKYGDIASMSHYGKMLAQGKGTAQNNALAARWLNRAASAGDAEAQYLLGKMYKKGLIHVEPEQKDLLRKRLKNIRGKYHDSSLHAEMRMANVWLKKAAAQGHQGAKKELEQDRLIKSWFFLIFGIMIFLFSCALFIWPQLFAELSSKGYHPAVIRYLSAPIILIMSIVSIIGAIVGL